MKRLLLISLILGGTLSAMDEPKVLLKVTNVGDEIVYVQALEYVPGRFYGGTYRELSKAVPVEPQEAEEILVDAQSANKRFLYYHHSATIMPDVVPTRLSIPGNLEEEHVVSVVGVKPEATALLRVTNTGDIPLYAQVFDYQYGTIKGTYKEQSKIVPIGADQTVEIKILKVTTLPKRYLYYSKSEVMGNTWVDIPEVLDDAGYDISVKWEFPVGERGATFIKQYNEEHPQKAELTWVRSGAPELTRQEQLFLQNREKITKPAIQKMLAEQGYENIDNWRMPRVAVCTSGGGFRAMLASLGFTQALSETGVLDTVTYGAALSGSTWMWLKWLHDGATPEVLPGVVEGISVALSKGLLAPEILQQSIMQKLFFLAKHQFVSQIPVSNDFKARFVAESTEHAPALVNLYGMLLADALFANDPERYSITLSSFADRAVSGTMPLPLCTAISTRDIGFFDKPGQDVHPKDYSWFEFSPFSVGILESTSFSGNGYIPTWAFGRRYTKGFLGGVTLAKDSVLAFNSDVQSDLKGGEYYAIEPGLNQLVAAFGSAFTVDTKELAAKSKDTPIVGLLGKARLFYGLPVNNFYDPKDTTKKVVIGYDREHEPLYEKVPVNANPFELRDGGIAFNLPLPPLFNPHRDINVIIILDASGDLNQNLGGALKEFVLYAKHYGMKIPDTLEHEETLTRALEEMKEFGSKVRVFGDWNKKDEMTVIYIPTILNDKLSEEVRETDPMKFDTFKLHYTPEETKELVGYATALGRHHAEFIKKVIVQKAQSLNQ